MGPVAYLRRVNWRRFADRAIWWFVGLTTGFAVGVVLGLLKGLSTCGLGSGIGLP